MDRHRGHEAKRDKTSKPGGCAAFGPLLEAYYHHALEPHVAHTVAEHAAGCAACSAALERFAATDRLIADAPMPAPGPELRQRLAARIATARTHRSDRSSELVSLLPTERTAVVQDMNDRDANNQRGTGPGRPARAGKGAQRMRVLLGTVAAALVVALLAGAFILQTRGTQNQTNVGHGNGPASGACTPSSIKAHLPANSRLNDLAMVSPDDGWAVGLAASTGGGASGSASSQGAATIPPTPSAQGPEAIRALILHFHNCAWTPVATNYPGALLFSISMVSANDGWAVGTTLGKPLALHYTNGAWTRVTLPEQSASQSSYEEVRMLSSHEGWIVVESTIDQQGNTSSGLLHLANGRWSTVNMPLRHVDDVLPVGQDEAWVADTSISPLTAGLYHYHAGKWTSTALTPGVFIDRLRMDSPADIWASAHTIEPLNSEGSQSAAVALHYDGANWSQVNLGEGGNAQLVQSFGTSAAWAFSLQRSHWGETISRMQYGGGNTWQTVQLPRADLLDVSPLVRVAPDDYWAIGHYVTPATGKVGTVVSVLLYFANGAWHEIPTH